MDELVRPQVLPKSVRIRTILAANPGAVTARELAKQIGCTQGLVYCIASRENLELKADTRKRPRFGSVPITATPEALERLREQLDNLPASKVAFVELPGDAFPLRAPSPTFSKEERARAELAKQLEEIFARQRRIWGDWV